jgi:Questin oxidase-like
MAKKEISRRHFIRDTAVATAVTYLIPNLSFGCKTADNTLAKHADVMDEALERMAKLAPLTNHGPMAAEALVSLSHQDSVIRFVEAYKKRFRNVYPAPQQPITQQTWREALGRGERVADWSNFFNRELKEAPWQDVLKKWTSILARGLPAAAGHGLIRTGHAVRSLSVKESELRRSELAEGLAYWAAYYQPLPRSSNNQNQKLSPAEAIQKVPVLPEEKRHFRGSIMASLQNLNEFAPFGNVVDLVKISVDAGKFLTEMTETFANVYVKNVNQQNFIALIHTITGTTATRTLLPYLSQQSRPDFLLYTWQFAAGLYSISADKASDRRPLQEPIKKEELIARAVDLNEEHAIKFIEACLREYALQPKDVYLQAAQDAATRIALRI